MTGFADDPRRDPLPRHHRLPDWFIPFLIFLAVALALRVWLIGNPVAGPADEQFYLLVGDRLRHGMLPYVDIWDRKPIGLFLLYAVWSAIGALFTGGSDEGGIVAYQIAALASAVATALMIRRLAKPIMPVGYTWGGVWAGIAYLCCLAAYNCYGGQAPVFYNLPVAGAALLLCGALADERRLLVGGALAMALIGMAIQIKYTVVFEGAAFGLALLWRAHRLGWNRARIIAGGGLWAALALAPTALALGYYAASGQAHAFIFANFVSIFDRSELIGPALARLAKELAGLLPFGLLLIGPASRPLLDVPAAAQRGFLRYWAVAALLGFLAFGSWYDHYVAPLLVPLCVLVAPALGARARWRTALLIGAATIAAVAGLWLGLTDHGSRADADRTTRLIATNLGKGCFYENEGDPILYLTTHSCLVTRYIFFTHLTTASEMRAIGTDPQIEVRRIMAARPAVVMMATEPQTDRPDWPTRRIVYAALARDYALYAISVIGKRRFELYRPKPAAPLR